MTINNWKIVNIPKYPIEPARDGQAMIMEMLVVAAVLVVIVLIAAYPLVTGTPPMPTSAKVKAAMLAAVPGGFEGMIFELGSGWGTLAFAFAKRFPKSQVVACELSPVPWLFSWLRQAVKRLPNLTIRRIDFHSLLLQEAALAVCYLHPGGMQKLKLKLDAELPSEALVLCNFFAVQGWQPESVTMVDDFHNSKVYLYRITR